MDKLEYPSEKPLEYLTPQLKEEILELIRNLIYNNSVKQEVNISELDKPVVSDSVNQTYLGSDSSLEVTKNDLHEEETFQDIENAESLTLVHEASPELQDKHEKSFENFLENYLQHQILRDSRTIFTWDPVSCLQYEQSSFIEECTIKEQYISVSSGAFSKFGLNIILAYEYTVAKDYDTALGRLDNAREIVKGDAYLMTFHQGLSYIIDVGYVHIHYKSNCINKFRDLLLRAWNFEKLSNKNKAIVLLNYAFVFLEYDEKFLDNALSMIREAMSLDSTNAEGYCLLGKCLQSLRERNNETNLLNEEIKAFEKAVELTNRPFMMVHLAESYLELNKLMLTSSESTFEHSETLIKKARDFTILAAARGTNCPYVNLKCAKILLWTLPPLFKDRSRAEKCINNALELVPDSRTINETAGNYFHFYAKDSERAVCHYKKAKTELADINCISLLYQMDRTDEIKQILDNLCTKSSSETSKIRAYCLKGFYHELVSKSLVEAVNAWRQAVEIDQGASVLTECVNSFRKKNKKTNVIRHAIQKIQEALKVEKDEIRRKYLKENLKFFANVDRIHNSS